MYLAFVNVAVLPGDDDGCLRITVTLIAVPEAGGFVNVNVTLFPNVTSKIFAVDKSKLAVVPETVPIT